VTIALSTPVFSLVGAFGASLVVTQKKAGVLLSLLTLPLCIPVLIYSVSAVIAAAAELPVTGHISLLCAFLVFSLTVAPFATAGSLRLMSGD
jgi:heme exporter protein B